MDIPPMAPPSAAELHIPAPQLAVAGLATSREVTVLTYNIRGLPWPLASNRAKALQAIGQELARMRQEGREPTIVLIQEGFRAEVQDLIKASGYSYWASGPSRKERASGPAPAAAAGFKDVRYPAFGEGWGKLTSGGLHVLSNLPITEVRRLAYRYCAGWDCLANKGAMLVRVQLPEAPVQIDIVNTHMNARRASWAPPARRSWAHNLQTEELLRFIDDHRAGGPLLVGGDFNVRNAPERYYYKASARPYTVVSEYCARPQASCGAEASPAEEPWLRSQDLQAFVARGAVEVRPEQSGLMFAADGSGARLSDHDGYVVRYSLRWRPQALAAAGTGEARPIELSEAMAR